MPYTKTITLNAEQDRFLQQTLLNYRNLEGLPFEGETADVASEILLALEGADPQNVS